MGDVPILERFQVHPNGKWTVLMSDNPYQSPQVTAVSSDATDWDPKLDRTASMLRQTKPWVRLISVITFLSSALMVLGLLFRMMMVGGAFGAVGAAIRVVYIAMPVFYIIPAVFLWRYANRIEVFVRERSTVALASALEAQKSFWKFVGIFTLIVMAISAVIIVFSIAANIQSA